MTKQGTSVSIIIDNFNYARFLEASIESALRQSYSNLEIIVVDDGSTDGSEEILRRFEGRVKVIRKENAGQASAFNTGLQAAQGYLVAFLDSDDELLPHAIETAASAWSHGCAKVQFPLEVVDSNGQRTGLLMPRAKLSSGHVLPSYLRTGRYVTSPTTGNLFSRSFLDRIFPIPAIEWAQTGDGYINTAAPFYGDIVALDQPLALYRYHGESMSSVCADGKVNVKQMEKLLLHAAMEKKLLEKLAAERGLHVFPGAVDSHWMHLKLRLSFYKLIDHRYFQRWRLLFKMVVAMINSLATTEELSDLRRLQYMLWTLCVWILPRAIAKRAIHYAFEPAPQSRLSFLLRRS